MKVKKVHVRTIDQAQTELKFMWQVGQSLNSNELHRMWLQLKESYRKFGVDFVIDSIKREPRKTADTLWQEVNGGRRRFNVN